MAESRPTSPLSFTVHAFVPQPRLARHTRWIGKGVALVAPQAPLQVPVVGTSPCQHHHRPSRGTRSLQAQCFHPCFPLPTPFAVAFVFLQLSTCLILIFLPFYKCLITGQAASTTQREATRCSTARLTTTYNNAPPLPRAFAHLRTQQTNPLSPPFSRSRDYNGCHIQAVPGVAKSVIASRGCLAALPHDLGQCCRCP